MIDKETSEAAFLAFLAALSSVVLRMRQIEGRTE